MQTPRLALALLLGLLLLSAGCGGGGGGGGDDPDELALAEVAISIVDDIAGEFETIAICLGPNSGDQLGNALVLAVLADGDVGRQPTVREADDPLAFQTLVDTLTNGISSSVELCFVPPGTVPTCVSFQDDLGGAFLPLVTVLGVDLVGYEITGFDLEAEEPVSITPLAGPSTQIRLDLRLVVLGREE